MIGSYIISNDNIKYIGNKQRTPINDVRDAQLEKKKTDDFLTDLASNPHNLHLHRIDGRIHSAAVKFFESLGAEWCNLPLTTMMISSPGEIYAGKKLDYTTDAMPVTLDWFDEPSIYLAESSQFYLELRLLVDQVDKVYSIYNSFRKERADFSHLAEFQHLEFEGHVTFEENIQIMVGLIREITKSLIEKNYEDLAYYLSDSEIEEVSKSFDEDNIEVITFKDALKILRTSLKDKKYDQLSLKHFGSYEEIALTRKVGKHCIVKEFPLEEIPFYHDQSFAGDDGKKFAKNADFILLGGREVIGSGQRITNPQTIKKKAEFFNLPAEDYEPYIKMRNLSNYRTTCGFGMGWQRYTQWLLKLPFIWDASHTPRSHLRPTP